MSKAVTSKKRKMLLGLMIDGAGHTPGDWRRIDANPSAMIEIQSFIHQAQQCERAKLDFYFYSDYVATSWDKTPYMINRLEPIAALSAVATATKHIGLVASISSTYTEPYNLARGVASLDHISGGRAAWNVVTSWLPDAGLNFGYDEMPKHKVRYQMAEEFLEVCGKLWDSWEDGALVFDKKTGQYVDKEKMHQFNYKGEFYKVAGPLNISRMPQGRPVIFQAGISEDGLNFATRHADAMFVVYYNIDEARAAYADIKARAKGVGRDPSKIFILPWTSAYVYSTEAEARDAREKRADLIPFELALRFAGKIFPGVDMSRFDPDKPFPDIVKPEHMEGSQGQILSFLQMVKKNNFTLRQAVQRYTMPRIEFLGTPEQVADQLQHWFETGASDGFVLSPSGVGQLEAFGNEVMPILRRRGIGREDYDGDTLRELMGLDTPRKPVHRGTQEHHASCLRRILLSR